MLCCRPTGVKVNGALLLWCLAAQTVAARHNTSCCRLLLSSARALSCCDTRLRTSHQICGLDPNRPDLSPVDYRIWTVIEEYVYQKQQVTSNIVDELWLEWHNYYLSQGRVETLIRRGGQFCHNFLANLLEYLCAKNYQNIMKFNKVVAKIKGYIFCFAV